MKRSRRAQCVNAFRSTPYVRGEERSAGFTIRRDPREKATEMRYVVRTSAELPISRAPQVPRHALARPGDGAGVALLLWIRVGRLCRPVLRRATLPALALLSYGTVTRAFTSENLVQQYLIALILALVVGSVQTLLVPQGAVPLDRVAATGPTTTEPCKPYPTPILPIPIPLLDPDHFKAFDNSVRRAITQLCDPTKLAVSPLLNLSIITASLYEQGLSDTPFHRVAILKEVLAELVNGLQPHRRTESCTDTACRFYNCLYYPYVLGITRRRAPTVLRGLREQRQQTGGPCSEQEQVLIWLLQVDEDTYYKWQRRGSDTLARILRERESAAIHAIPAASDRAAVA